MVPLFALGSSARPTILIVSSSERLLRLFRYPSHPRPAPPARTQKGRTLEFYVMSPLSDGAFRRAGKRRQVAKRLGIFMQNVSHKYRGGRGTNGSRASLRFQCRLLTRQETPNYS